MKHEKVFDSYVPPAAEVGFVKEAALGRRRREERSDRHRPRALPIQRHVARVASKRGDLALHPLEGGDCVPQPKVRNALLWEVHEAQRTEAIVHGDGNDVLPLQRVPEHEESRLRVASLLVCAAVEPHDDGQRRRRRRQ